MKIKELFISSIFAIVMLSCSKSDDKMQTINEKIKEGNFAEAQILINSLKENALIDSLALWIEKNEALMERIQIDFSKTETEIKNELLPFYPQLTDEQLRGWEANNTLEMKVINGERKYFRHAVRNLFRIDTEAKKVWQQNDTTVTNSLESFCLEHTANLVQQTENGENLLEKPAKFTIEFSITLDADAVPAGETIKYWMPFPRESEPRQQNVVFISADTENYVIAPNSNQQRSIYFEKISIAGKPTVFSYSASFEIAPEYHDIDTSKIRAYNKNSELYQQYTKARPPHIIFSDPVKILTDSLTRNIENPFEKARAIFYWIDGNIPWASALEYSIIESIPEYVLENRHGDCGMKTLLFMSMARYAGIPCKWQSGWMLHPEEINLHDWCQVYYEGIGWVPVDQSFGTQNSDNKKVREFYLSGIDEYRWIINDDFGSDFEPPKKFYRSEPIDFQRGELEWKGGNLYFNQWDYSLKLTRSN